MKAPYEKCSLEFEICKNDGSCGIEWVSELMQQTLVDEIICITDISVAKDGTSRDMVSALIQFCKSKRNADSIILLMCGDRIPQYSKDTEEMDDINKQRNRAIASLANQKAAYEMIGFADISLWVDYSGTCVFAYRNERYADFLMCLTAFQAASYISSMTGTDEQLSILRNQLKDAPKARDILRTLLDELDADSTKTKAMSAF